MEHEALKRSRVHPGRAGPAGPTQPPGRAPAWPRAPPPQKGQYLFQSPRRPAHTPPRSGVGRGSHPLLGSQARGGDDRADPPAGNGRLTQLASPTQTSPSEEEPVGMGKAERRRKPRSASLPFLVPAQSVTVTKSPGGETLDAARRRVRAGAWARPQSPRDFCTVCLAIL